ncbi:MAG: hypothetical protein ACE5EC_10725, partial [Phycisphaerae bacterium]
MLSADGSSITTPLTHASLAGDRQWADLDRRGNWLDTRWTVAPTGTPELRQQVRTANGANEYTSIDPMDGSDLLWPETIAHDAAGNLTVDPTAVGAGGVVSPSGQRYEYDEENRLTAVRRTGDDLLLAEYAYDALGRRVETIEHVDAATGLPLPAPCRTRHIYAGIETIEEYDVCEDAGGVETATLLREFVWGDGGRFPEPIALIDHTDAG